MSKISNNLYENNEVYHPNGNLMFYCKMKRINWYLARGLARKIEDGKYILTFVPNGDGEPTEYLKKRRNICVVSGETENLTKHHIVPYMYRRLFPMEYKDKNSTDLVLLTDDVHNRYEMLADVLKKELFEKHITEEEVQINRDIEGYKKVHRILSNGFDKLPAHVLNDIVNRYKEYRMRDVHLLEPIDYVQLIVEREGVESLILMWKTHFIEYAKPEFMPKWWDPTDIKKINRYGK